MGETLANGGNILRGLSEEDQLAYTAIHMGLSLAYSVQKDVV